MNNNKNSLFLPFPHFLDKFVSPKVVASLFIFTPQFFLHNHLRCNASMVTPRHPESGQTFHAIPAIHIKLVTITYNYHTKIVYHLVMASSTAFVRACPKCKDPVTLGGGITMTKFPLGFSSVMLFLCKDKT